MPSVLIYGSPEHSADLFHAVPAGIVDPFLYLENDGRRAATVTVLEADKVSALGDRGPRLRRRSASTS